VPAGRRLYRLAEWLGHPLESWPHDELHAELRETPRPMSVKEAVMRNATRPARDPDDAA
jgi:hypothetical protein